MTHQQDREGLGRAHLRPLIIRCFTCIYFGPTTDLQVQADGCLRYPIMSHTSPDDFCGEWRFAWPEIDPEHQKESRQEILLYYSQPLRLMQ